MWVTFVQETKVLKDPIMDMTVGDHSTWKSAFIINKDGDTTAIVGDMEWRILLSPVFIKTLLDI